MGPYQQHHIRNAVLCLKYLLGVGDVRGALEQVRRIDIAMRMTDLAEAYSKDPACAGSGSPDLAGLIEGAPRPMLEELIRLCRRALDAEG